MPRAIDSETADTDDVYHIVCHDCPTELLSHGEAEAERQLSKHRSSTGHNVEYAALHERKNRQ